MRNARKMALGGILAALAVVIMAMGGLIPVATFVCPVLCMLLLQLVLQLCGRHTAWAWYGAVALLSLLLGPDKEASGLFLFLGFYPIVKPGIDRLRLRLLYKLVLFNALIVGMYALLIQVLGIGEIAREYQELGVIMSLVMLLGGNAVFLMTDVVLTRLGRVLSGGGSRHG